MIIMSNKVRVTVWKNVYEIGEIGAMKTCNTCADVKCGVVECMTRNIQS